MKIQSSLNTSLAREITPELIHMNTRQAIKAFVDGLNIQELRTTLRLREFNNIAEAITVATEIRGRIVTKSGDPDLQNNPNQNKQRSQKVVYETVFCNRCNASQVIYIDRYTSFYELITFR